jgi:DNA-directed RNA polymerase specialized sigma24 family protein
MVERKLDPDLVEWKPEWKGKDLEYYEQVRGQLEPAVSMLRSVRELLGLSQAEVAEILRTTQSNVSKMEGRADTGVGLLSKLMQSKGGSLKIVAEFGGKAREYRV